jgi:Xaa-Pro aminopeptidase
MKTKRPCKLLEIEWPDFGECGPPPPVSADEFGRRIDLTRAAMKRLRLTHLVVYADREHFANLTYLIGFDPKWEEALLILRPTERPLLLVGNECAGYLPITPLHAAGKLRSERYQPLSLPSQPRDDSRLLKEIFRDEGIARGARVGCAGLKYFTAAEHPDPDHALDLPAYVADVVRDLAGRANATNAAGIFSDPDTGLRTFCLPDEIAYFEYTNILASEAVKRMLFGLREGMTDFECLQLVRFNGEPLGAHPSIKTGATRGIAFPSPRGHPIRRGDPFSASICYRGSNCCRVGWVAESAQDLPEAAKDYVANFAGPYFEAVSRWFAGLRLGASAGRLAREVFQDLPFAKYRIHLNPGHLIHLEEWLSSPFYPDSKIRLHSGMAIQSDVIPSSPEYFSSRMEDGLVLADAALRRQLKARFPACLARCEARRAFIREVIGVPLSDDVLPLSNMPAIVPPFLLRPNLVFALER